ncbi:NUDIX domain-containing protein [Mucilaginibacter ximonensis]|uniref:NUDIX domain-containing protein n=1 Tax=Mucilaginibacter ximonensis TaxID=538021 RepID=A0ABW5Y814_9SPHI
MYPFNVRVYGLLINENQEILVSDEQEYGMQFTKFPGGGLEYGEGIIDGLKREFIEECSLDIDIINHFYTTDFFVKSAFNESQIISVYYVVQNKTPFELAVKTTPFDFGSDVEPMQTFRWIQLSEMKAGDFTFPIDQHVAKLLLQSL